MSSINQIMTSAANTMGAHKTALQLASANIENANVPGYSRQRMALTSGPVAGYGAQAGSPYSVRSGAIQRSILGASQSLGYHDARTSVLALAEPGLNDLDGAGVSAALDSFYEAIHNLAAAPTDLAARHNVLSKAESLAHSVKVAAGSIGEAQSAAEEEAGIVVGDANVMLSEIADLNRRIAASSGSAGELVDQRDILLTKLSESLSLQTIEQQDGTISVFTTGGQPLVDGDVASKLELGGGGTELLTVSVRKSDGSLLSPIKLAGGRLGGVMDARDGTLARSLEKLDAFAYTLAEQYNTLHASGHGLDGSTGNPLFLTLSTPKGAASSLRVDEAIKGNPNALAAAGDPTKLPGDDSVIQAMLALENAAVAPGGLTLRQGYDAAATELHSGLKDATTRRDTAGARLAQYEAQRASLSGVAIQEEMMALTASERAFEAVSRVINTANELYDTILRMV